MAINFKLLLVLLCFLSTGLAIITSFKVSSAPSTILVTATLTAQFSTGVAMSANDYFEITTPTQVSITQGPITGCSENFQGITVVCSGSGQVITVVIASSITSFTTLRITIDGFTNPSSSQPTDQFSVSSFTSTGNSLESSQLTQNPTLTATADAITSASLVSNSAVVGVTAQAVLTLTNKNEIPAGGRLTLTFPGKWNAGAPSNSQLSYFTATPTCTGVTNVDAGVTCAVSGDTLTVSSAFPQAVPASSSISLSIASLRNPRSAKSITGLTLTTQNSGGFDIDSTGTLAFTGVTTAASFSSTSVNVANTQVGIDTVLQIIVSLSIPVDIGAYVVLTYPNDLPLSSQPISTILGSGGYNDPNAAGIAVSGQQQTLPALVSDFQSTLSGILIIRFVTNPTSTKPLDSFHYSLYDSANNIIASATSGIAYTPTSGTLSNLAISADATEVYATTTWTFSLTLQTTLVQDSQIRITLPAEVGTVDGSCAPLSALSGVTNAAAGCTISGQVITVSNPFTDSAGSPAGSALSFKLKAGTIINPVTTAAITSILFQTRTPASSGDYLVDTGSISAPFTLTPGEMTGATISASPDTAYTSSTHTIAMTSGHPYPANAKIVITLPSEISIISTAASTTSCAAVANLAGMECQALSANSIQILTKLASQTAASTVYSFSIGGVRNQRTTASSSSYSFAVTTADGSAAVENKSAGIFLQITAVPQYTSFSVIPTSFVNSAITTYTFDVTTPTLLLDGDKIQLTPQTEVTNPTSLTPTCQGASANLESSLTCEVSGNLVIVSLDFTAASGNQLVSGSSFSFSVAGYQNPSNTDAPTSHFSVLTVTSTSSANVVEYTGSLQVQTTTAATMLAHTSVSSLLVTSSLVPSFTTTTYTFAARTVSTTPKNAIFRVYVPSEITVGTSPVPACSGDGSGLPGSLTCTYSSTNGYFTITDAFPSLTNYPPRDFTLEITNLQNPPTAVASSSFKLETRTSGNGLIDSLNSGMTVTVNCNAPCATCNLGQHDQCLSCITNPAPSGDPYLLQETSCVTSCSTSYLANTANTQCDPCTNNCHTCSGSLSFCTACTGIYSLKNNQCLDDCGDGFYSSNNQCSACDSASAFCLTCNTAANVCTSCITGKLLQGSNCVDTCSTGYVANTTTKVCDQCTGNCLACQVTVDNCVTCAANFFNYAGTCVTSCPADQTTIEDSVAKTCTACDTTCATCIGTVTTCTTCKTGLLKYGSTCISSCPVGTTIESNGNCVDCSLTCATCETTTTNCLTCNANMYLVSNPDGTKTCSSTCPADQYISGDSCVNCPSGQQLNSAGNGCESIPGGTSGAKVEFVIFPFLVVAGAMLILALASKLYKKQSYFFSNVVLLWGFIETAVLAFQAISAFFFGSTTVWIVTAAAFAFLLLCNIILCCVYSRKILRDKGFSVVRRRKKHCYRFMGCLAMSWNFRIIRLHYSRFFGAQIFKQQFSNFQDNFAKPLGAITILSVISVSIPIVILDLAAVVFWLPWGYQLTITCIETLIIEALMLIWIAFEFKAFRDSEFDDKYYEEVEVIDELDQSDRNHILSQIIRKIEESGPLGFHQTRDADLDSNLSYTSDVPENHAAAFLNDRAPPRKVQSYPPSPRSLHQKISEMNLAGGFDKSLLEPFAYPDNVYAESEPAQPLKRKGKKFITSCTQTHRKKRRKVVNEEGDLETIWETDSESEYDEEEEAQLMRENLLREAEQRQREEEIKEMALERKTQKQIESEIKKVSEGFDKKLGEQANLIEVMLVAAKERERKEEEEKKRQEEERLKREEEWKQAEEEKRILEDQMIVMQQIEQEPLIQPEVGTLELQSPQDVVGENDQLAMEQVMEEHQIYRRESMKRQMLDLGSTEQLPLWQNVEKYSLQQNTIPGGGTPIGELEQLEEAVLYPELENVELAQNYIDIDDIRGEFIHDHEGNVVITKNEKGNLVDKQGRRVNRLGYLVDDHQNVVNSKGEPVEIIGDFDKDAQGNFKIIVDPTEPFTGKRANYLDKQGRPVNDKGYLIDREEGHIVDSKGAIVAKKGDLDFNERGEAIVLFDKNGIMVDKQGRRVNKKGYLTDNSGNLLNDENKVTIVNEELSSDEELPELVPTEKPKRRALVEDEEDEELMQNIEKHAEQASKAREGGSKDVMADQVEQQLHKMRPGSGSTSVNSEMDATPSTFNIMNQRFESDKKRKEVPIFHPHPPVQNVDEMDDDEEERKTEEEEDEEYEESEEGEEQYQPQEDSHDPDFAEYQEITQPRRVKPKRYKAPGQKDKKLAMAYGGEARGPPVRRKMKSESNRGFMRRQSPPRSNKLEHLTGSVSGLGYSRRPQSGIRAESSLMTAPGGRGPGYPAESPSPMRQHDIYRRGAEAHTGGGIGKPKRKGKGKKGKKGGLKRPDSRNSDLERIYGRVDDLESSAGSEYTIFSNASRQTSRSRLDGFKKIKGLETIYLQRLDPTRPSSNVRKSVNKKSFSATPNKISANLSGMRKPRFRETQDRFQDDPNFLATESEKDDYSMMSENYKQLSKLNTSSRGTGLNQTVGYNSANMFHSNFKASPRGMNKWI